MYWWSFQNLLCRRSWVETSLKRPLRARPGLTSWRRHYAHRIVTRKGTSGQSIAPVYTVSSYCHHKIAKVTRLYKTRGRHRVRDRIRDLYSTSLLLISGTNANRTLSTTPNETLRSRAEKCVIHGDEWCGTGVSTQSLTFNGRILRISKYR